jgi:hypothetical protein
VTIYAWISVVAVSFRGIFRGVSFSKLTGDSQIPNKEMYAIDFSNSVHLS